MGGSPWKIHPGELTRYRMAKEVVREYHPPFSAKTEHTNRRTTVQIARKD